MSSGSRREPSLTSATLSFVSVRPKSVLLFAAAVVLAGCAVAASPVPSGGPYPDACADIAFPARQCDAIVAVAEAQASIAPKSVTSIDILRVPYVSTGTVGTGGVIALVRFHRSGQPDQTEEVSCPGVTRDGAFACYPDAQVRIREDRGLDHDVPCDNTGKNCATLPPSPRPAVQAMARPLRVASLDIPLDHLGRYEVEVGEAGLPDGALSARSATLADPNPETFWIAEDIEIDVRPVDPARPPIHSAYREWFDGVEPVKVFLVFDVTELKSPSILQIRDLLVE
jgi:hypothetical protein